MIGQFVLLKCPNPVLPIFLASYKVIFPIKLSIRFAFVQSMTKQDYSEFEPGTGVWLSEIHEKERE